MPNWCENRVSISTDTPEQLTEICDFVSKDGNPFSLDAIVPMPEILRLVIASPRKGENGRFMLEGNVEATEEQQSEIDATGYTDWYSWAVANWGTKWDTDGESVRVDDNGPADVTYSFDTAWAPPEVAILSLRERFPDANITAFYDEPGVGMAGYI